LNRARELQHKVSVFREFQTAGAEHWKASTASATHYSFVTATFKHKVCQKWPYAGLAGARTTMQYSLTLFNILSANSR